MSAAVYADREFLAANYRPVAALAERVVAATGDRAVAEDRAGEPLSEPDTAHIREVRVGHGDELPLRVWRPANERTAAAQSADLPVRGHQRHGVDQRSPPPRAR